MFTSHVYLVAIIAVILSIECIEAGNYPKTKNRFIDKAFTTGAANCKLCAERKPYPKKQDRIAIVGAGASGIHMAYKLQNLGYQDITIFERSDRVGGKSRTISYKGTKYEMGSVFVSVGYKELIRLVEEFNFGPLIPTGKSSRWISPYKYFNSEYPLYIIATEYGITDPTEASLILMNKIQEYVRLHKELFSEYEGELFPRPSADVLEKIRGTFMEFLDRYNLTALSKTIFQYTMTFQGYGYLDEVSAIYGLMWNEPSHLLAVLQSLEDNIFMLTQGYQHLWEKIVEEKGLKVVYNADVVSIKRFGKVGIRYNQLTDGCASTISKHNEFDFLILAADLSELIKGTIRNPTNEEVRIFNKMVPTYYTSTLIDSEYGRRSNTPHNYYVYNLESRTDHAVQIAIDWYSKLNNLTGEDYKNGVFPGNKRNEFIQSALHFQQGSTFPTSEELDGQLASYLASFGIGNYSIIERNTWRYFPKFPPADLSDGIIWDILDMQGHQRTWYIGSSVCMESMKSVLDYNNMLLKKFGLE